MASSLHRAEEGEIKILLMVFIRIVVVDVVITMFLAAADVFGPITSVFLFAVQKSSGAELLGGSAVPARPVTDARLFVTEDAVLVVAWAHRDWRICFKF